MLEIIANMGGTKLNIFLEWRSENKVIWKLYASGWCLVSWFPELLIKNVYIMITSSLMPIRNIQVLFHFLSHYCYNISFLKGQILYINIQITITILLTIYLYWEELEKTTTNQLSSLLATKWSTKLFTWFVEAESI